MSALLCKSLAMHDMHLHNMQGLTLHTVQVSDIVAYAGL